MAGSFKVFKREVAMICKKIFFVAFFVFMLTQSLVGPAFSQGREDKKKIYCRKIEWVSRDFRYIGINERRVLIPPGIKVFDQKGNILDIRDLKSGRSAVLEKIRNKDGSIEERIVIKK
jgi:hypothetical protein